MQESSSPKAREQNLHVIIPVVDRPFQLPEELAKIQGMQTAVHHSFSQLVQEWNALFQTPKGNKYTGFLEPERHDLHYRLALPKHLPGSSNMIANRLRFNYAVAPRDFAQYAVENFTDRNAVFDHLAPEQRMGGNNLNAFNTRAAWLQMFDSLPDDMPLPKEVAVVSNGIEGQQNITREHIASLVGRYPHLFDMHIMEGVPFRRSLHIPFTTQKGDPDTLMLGEPHPDKNVVIQAMQHALKGTLTRQYFQQIFVPFNIGRERANMRQQVLIPSSAFPDDVITVIRNGDVFAGNDQEFESATGTLLPEVVVSNGDVHQKNMPICEQHIQAHWSASDERRLEHVAPIGLREGNTMAAYRYEHDMYGVQVAPVRGESEDAILHDMQHSEIGKNVEGTNTTGGGDSKVGTQTILVNVLPKYLPLWLAQNHYSLSSQQKRYVVMAVAESLGAMVAHIVRNSTQASLWNVPPERLSRLLDTTIRSVVQLVSEKGDANEMFFEAPYGVQVAMWKMHRKS